MYIYSFEKLEVWKEAKEFTKTIYAFTSTCPGEEKFGLTSELRRASISICSNIAEGSARKTDKDKAHFTTISFSSAVEVLNRLFLPKNLISFLKVNTKNVEQKSKVSPTNLMH